LLQFNEYLTSSGLGLLTIFTLQQAVVLKHNKPRPRVAHRGIARFLGIDQKCNQVVPLSLHTFPENFMQIGPAVSRNLANKETKKERYK